MPSSGEQCDEFDYECWEQYRRAQDLLIMIISVIAGVAAGILLAVLILYYKRWLCFKHCCPKKPKTGKANLPQAISQSV